MWQLSGKHRIQYIKVINSGANQYFTYDTRGNITKDLLNGIDINTYDCHNLPLEMQNTSSGSTAKYAYNDAGSRTHKKVRIGDAIADEYYLHGAGSEELAIFNCLVFYETIF